MDRYEFVCPVHGVMVSFLRTDPAPPVVPNTCSRDMHGERLRCGERLRFRWRWTTPAGARDARGILDVTALRRAGGSGLA
jgi:hypothetical protein